MCGGNVKSAWPTLAVLLLLCGCNGEASSRLTRNVPFCDLVDHAGVYKGMQVAFHAQVTSNGMDRSALTGSACSGYGVAFDVTQAQRSFEAASKVIMGIGRPGTLDKIVEADFTGVLHLKDGKPIIYLTNVRNVSYRVTDRASNL